MTKMGTILVTLAGFLVLALGLLPDHEFRAGVSLSFNASDSPVHKSIKSVNLPGNNPPSEPNVVQVGAHYDPNQLPTEGELLKFREEGHWLSCLLHDTDAEAGLSWPDPYGRTLKSMRSIWVGTLERKLSMYSDQ